MQKSVGMVVDGVVPRTRRACVGGMGRGVMPNGKADRALTAAVAAATMVKSLSDMLPLKCHARVLVVSSFRLARLQELMLLQSVV